MKRWDAEIAAKWAAATESEAHRSMWSHAVLRRLLLDDIRDFQRRARREITAIHELRRKGVTDDLA